MWSSLHKTLAGAVAITAFAAMSVAFAPAASASYGGGCIWQPTVTSYGSITACISAKNETILPDGYVNWNYIPPNCSVVLYLTDPGGIVYDSYTYPCGWHHYGPLGSQQDGGYYYVSELAVETTAGPARSDSPWEYLSY